MFHCFKNEYIKKVIIRLITQWYSSYLRQANIVRRRIECEAYKAM